MLLELAIGDAYGAGFEYADAKVYRAHNDLSGYVRHARHKNVPGTYTDDTQMSLAVAEAVLEDPKWTPERLASRFVAAFKRDPRQGYASSFYRFLLEVRDGDDFIARIRPDSDKSGGAMRAAPAGVYPTIAEVLQRAQKQAVITHNTPAGISAAQAAALAAHYFLYRIDRKEHLGEFLEKHVAGPWNRAWAGAVGPKGWMSVCAAVTAVMRSASMSELLKMCVDFTGDVDTVAAIALAVAASSPEVSQDLPQNLIDGLEDGPFGIRYIRDLDRRLLLKVSLPPTP